MRTCYHDEISLNVTSLTEVIYTKVWVNCYVAADEYRKMNLSFRIKF